ncbi:DUF1543 domain-containing protein [Lacipirellula limnantheis]|uniref:Uncharacterized protein n=1 Tax=Lacipirellula limnantheis TaxID=2528024 RepID=A0A517TXX2_9BACT|nr:DUF1543 domain-containing protein [Lacipirellula limnantheis]QDT73201.1 hypothetical protein I41_23900 [Lacipirellula limnantheis]
MNLGGYADGEFTALNASTILVAVSQRENKRRAKSTLLIGKSALHADELCDVDDCLEIRSVDGYVVHLTATSDPDMLAPHNGYWVISKEVIFAIINRGGSD